MVGAGTALSSYSCAIQEIVKARSDIGAGTQAKYFSVARSFLRELYRLRVVPFDLTANVKSIKVNRAHKRAALTDDEFMKVLQFIDSPASDPRAKVILALMAYQGLRRVEISRLNVEHFDRDGKTLAVLGKGKDDRELVDLHPNCVHILAGYLETNRLKSGPLFPSSKRVGMSLSGHQIWRIGMHVHHRLGLSDRNLHGYRKRFTTKLIQSGMNLLDGYPTADH